MCRRFLALLRFWLANFKRVRTIEVSGSHTGDQDILSDQRTAFNTGESNYGGPGV